MKKALSRLMKFFLAIFALLLFGGCAKGPVSNRGEQQSEAAIKPDFLFVGDLMLDRHVFDLISNQGVQVLLSELAREVDFFQFDFVSANLEGAVTDDGRHYLPEKAYDFAFRPDLVESLKQYNFNFFNLSNNHIDDQGLKGMEETRLNLDRLKIGYSGCSEGRIGECSARVVAIKEKKIGFIGISAIYSRLDEVALNEELNDLKNETDLIVVNIHWGQEYQKSFSQTQKQLAHQLIDMGADVIIGHHPHVIEGVETYKGGLIFYSLGNFIFDQYFSQETQEGLMVSLQFENNQGNIALYPLKSESSRLSLFEQEEREAFFKELYDLSEIKEEYANDFKKGKIKNFKFD